MDSMKFNSPFTLGNVRRQLVAALEERYGAGEATAMAEIIFEDLKGWSKVDLIMNSDVELSDYIVGKTEEYCHRLLEGEPIQYITGRARFHGFELMVTPAVLIPRPETEELVDIIVDENPASDLRVLDVGTGSGAIAIALARNLRFPEVSALDISGEALEIARANAKARHANINFLNADIFRWEADGSVFDIIVSNPPYIAESEKTDMDPNVLEHEPALALFVPDGDPLRFYNRIADIGLEALSAGGKLYFEINPRYSVDVCDMLRDKGYSDVRIIKDLSGKDRFAAAVRPAND